MRIAAITITYNDDYKYKEWQEHFLEYENEIFLHVIVDNNSEQGYKEKLQEGFSRSHIIYRTSNGGCTGAYNDGIRYALSIPDVDAIMLIGNDIRLKVGASTIMHRRLFSDAKLGMIAPILLTKDSMIVEDFGCSISKALIMIPYCVGKVHSNINENIHYCEALTGGMNLSKREFYENVGLQDDNLFMYSDEVDMGLRAKKSGYTLAAISDAVSWHQHINKDTNTNRRDPYTKYLAGRNKVYVAKKHYGLLRVIYVFLFYVFGSLYKILINLIKGNFYQIKEYFWLIFGAVMGLLGNMKPNRFSVPSEDVELQK
ncbi:glycosyltransferase family 2 protein [Flavobacterium muglaense]|uniref:Glycosyltransferase family 2 protein n=1 Tax=Flavobacterium muglaense TaxID=2764716 RepID=A0A923SIS0_9FLAO|nr:glycosyltransferase family 2 protein [Flavobacterium muglaense]MBC5837039.1 glycosyltransferase family 2 protein [Flavobacterium muglaense]MBC5843568.1 glycosyltransferase family 2 protein [Flavobacterium muglaense]